MVKTVLYVHVNALWGGGGFYFGGRFNRGFVGFGCCMGGGGGGLYMEGLTLIQYKNVILLYLARDSLIKILWYLKGTEA